MNFLTPFRSFQTSKNSANWSWTLKNWKQWKVVKSLNC